MKEKNNRDNQSENRYTYIIQGIYILKYTQTYILSSIHAYMENETQLGKSELPAFKELVRRSLYS